MTFNCSENSYIWYKSKCLITTDLKFLYIVKSKLFHSLISLLLIFFSRGLKLKTRFVLILFLDITKIQTNYCLIIVSQTCLQAM